MQQLFMENHNWAKRNYAFSSRLLYKYMYLIKLKMQVQNTLLMYKYMYTIRGS